MKSVFEMDVKERKEILDKVLAMGMEEVLTYEQAWVYSLHCYNMGGDQFVECCSKSDYDETDPFGHRVWANTKLDLAVEQALWEELRADRMGW